MNKSLLAEQYNNIVNMYSDYITVGLSQPHTVFDFSNFDVVPTINEVDEQVTKISNKLTMQNNEVASINVAQAGSGKHKTTMMIDLSMEIAKCKKCVLSQKAKKIIPGKGLVNTDIFVLSNPVTPKEEKEDYPLSGEEKVFFLKWLSAINIDPNKIFITNLLKCNWTTNQLKIEFIEACREHLDKQIDIVKPKIILTLGQLALSSLKKAHADIMNEHGRIIDYRGYKVFPIFDPGMVLKNPTLKTIVWTDLKNLKSIIENG